MSDIFYASCPLCDAPEHHALVDFDELAFVTCARCALLYKQRQAPALSAEYEAAYFQEGQALYLKRFVHRVHKCMRQLQAVREYIPKARDVLDIGCSAGYMMQAARELGMRGTGLDCSTFAVGLCRERGLRAVVGDIDAMPFADATFDIVTAKHTLEHMRDPKAALAEMRRVLRPGGVALIIVPDAQYWKRFALLRRGSYFRPDRAGWQHHIYYAPAHLSRMSQAAGLQPLHAGKAVLRRRLCHGWRALWEYTRYAAVWVGCTLARRLHMRREIQLIAQRSVADTQTITDTLPSRRCTA